MSLNKFTVLYSFQVKPGMEQEFVEAWSIMTRLIYQYERSYGSRLHKSSTGLYVGYAQWPDRKTWAESGQQLPAEAESVRQTLRNACVDIKTLYELEVIEDLLQEKQH